MSATYDPQLLKGVLTLLLLRLLAERESYGYEVVQRLRDAAHEAAVRAFLAVKVPEAPFDVVFLDPPYDTPSTEVAAVLGALAAGGWVAPGARVVVERPKAAEPLSVPDGWRIEKERTYGDTLLVVALV